jgi:hypothetical protein
MIPSHVSEYNPSKAEIRLFERMRIELNDDWVVLHSLGLLLHPKKPWSEIDFVLIGPQGLFCLEVKGGRVSRKDGIWCFTDRAGRIHQKKEGPFQQVASASAALYDYLRRERPSIGNSITGFGVATPDIRFDISGPDIDSALVYDVNDTTNPFKKYLERLAGYWASRLAKANPNFLSPIDRTALINLLRGDFELIPSLQLEINQTNKQLIRLTEEQYRVLDGLSENKRVIIRGGAGTGKTLLAAEEARRLSRAGMRTLLCCFNRKLGEFLRGNLKDCDLLVVRHFHGLMTDYIREAGLMDSLPDAQEADLFRVFYPQVCLDALFGLDRLGEFDVLLIDEGQDLLLDTFLDVFDGLVKGGLKSGSWKIFFDPKQDIFSGLASNVLAHLLQYSPAQYKLAINCRNTIPIAVGTSLLSQFDSDETLRIHGPNVENHWYKDVRDERRLVSRCIGRILSQGVKPECITILSRRQLQNSCIGHGLIEINTPLIDMASSGGLSFPNAIRFSTVSLFKGLESDVVILVDCDDLWSNDSRLHLYVATSRARVLLAVFLDQGLKPQYQANAEAYGKRLCKAIAKCEQSSSTFV